MSIAMKAEDKSTPQAKVQEVSVNTRLMWRWWGRICRKLRKARLDHTSQSPEAIKYDKADAPHLHPRPKGRKGP